MTTPHAHCSWCGTRFDPGQPWPRTCAGCGHTTWLNPAPVAVALVPVGGGLLAVRRGIEPGYGKLALPGGFINLSETWQQAAAREVAEETGVMIDPASLRAFAVRSTLDGRFLLVFGLASPLPDPELTLFRPDAETLECAILRGPEELAFPLHTEVAAEYFAHTRWEPAK